MAHGSKVTRDHEEIRRWAEERGGKPSHVRSTGGGDDPGILRIDFPGYSGEGSLEQISWDEFFEKFDERGLALLYQEETAEGQKSNFNKLVSAETAQEAGSGSRGGRGRGGASRKGAKGSGAKKATAKKATAKKATKKAVAKKAVKKAAAKKSTSKKAVKKAAKKAAPKKATAKKTATKKAAGRSSRKGAKKSARRR